MRCATPLFLALCMVELIDLVFAVDSVPATFAITHAPFIVYTGNIFAILGLRALYFARVVVFIGGKIFLVGIIGKIPPVISRSLTYALIAGGVIAFLWKTRREQLALGKP